ncbi:MAG: hypothetical protein GY885_17985 [Phycisphaeraceae bacterium]|nr:hypothetical protein [Phycisphaeraceae bacterium]
MPTRPDLTNRTSWVRLFEHGAKAEGSTSLEHPPQYGFDADDPAIKAWELVRTGDAAARLLELEGIRPDEASIGPMLRPRDDLAIEVWTECELSVMHAAWRVVLDGEGDPEARRRLTARLRTAVTWHLEHTQPDNATSRPWAVHVFLELGHPDVEAIDYAANMLHAAESARMSGGGDDRLRGWILDDAASALRRVGTPRIGAVESIGLGNEGGPR